MHRAFERFVKNNTIRKVKSPFPALFIIEKAYLHGHYKLEWFSQFAHLKEIC